MKKFITSNLCVCVYLSKFGYKRENIKWLTIKEEEEKKKNKEQTLCGNVRVDEIAMK